MNIAAKTVQFGSDTFRLVLLRVGLFEVWKGDSHRGHFTVEAAGAGFIVGGAEDLIREPMVHGVCAKVGSLWVDAHADNQDPRQ